MMVVTEEIACPYCRQEFDYDFEVEEAGEFLCKHPTADGGMCQRTVESQDKWCWDHAKT